MVNIQHVFVFSLGKSLAGLNLRNNAMTGSLPSGLGKLTTLEYLDLSGNPWGSPDSDTVAMPASLCDLDLKNFTVCQLGRLGGLFFVLLTFCFDFDTDFSLAIATSSHMCVSRCVLLNCTATGLAAIVMGAGETIYWQAEKPGIAVP